MLHPPRIIPAEAEVEGQLLRKSEVVIGLVQASDFNKDEFLYNLFYLLHYGRSLSSNLAIQKIARNLLRAVTNENFDIQQPLYQLLLLRAVHLYLELTVTYQDHKKKIDDSLRTSWKETIEKIRRLLAPMPQLAYELSSIEAYLNALETDFSLEAYVFGALTTQDLSASIAAITGLRDRIPDRYISDVRYIRQMAHLLAQEMQKHDLPTSEGKEPIENILNIFSKLKGEVFRRLKEFNVRNLLNPEDGTVRLAQTWVEALTHMLKNTRQAVFIEALLHAPPLALNHFQRGEFTTLGLLKGGIKSPIRYFLAVSCTELRFHREAQVSEWSEQVLKAIRDDGKEKPIVKTVAEDTGDSAGLWTRWMRLGTSEESISAAPMVEDREGATLIDKGVSESKTPIDAEDTAVDQEILADTFIHELLYVKTEHDVELRKKFDPVDPGTKTVQWLAITGMTGSGKTSLATQYLLEEKRHGAIPFTFIVENVEQWETQLSNLIFSHYGEAKQKEIIKCNSQEKAKKLLHHNIREIFHAKSNWILLLDNMDQEATSVLEDAQHLLADVGPGRVLITSQDSNLDNIRTLKLLDLSTGLSPDDAIKLMYKLLEPLQESLKQLGTEEVLEKLVEELEYMPLGLVQAGSFLLASNQKKARFGMPLFTYDDYRQRLREQSSSLEQETENQVLLSGSKEMPRTKTGAIKTQKAAICLSLNKALRRHVDKTPRLDLWRLLNFMSSLSGEHIPQGLLRSYLKEAKIGTTESRALSDVSLQNILIDLLVQAKDYSLVHIEPHKDPFGHFHLRMHRSMQRELKESFRPHLMGHLAPREAPGVPIEKLSEIPARNPLEEASDKNSPEKNSQKFSLTEDSLELPGRLVDVPPDGNCFFHAVLHELRRQGLTAGLAFAPELQHLELRIRAIDYLKAHPDLLRDPHELNDRGVTPEEYLSEMSKDKAYAEGPIIDALALFLNVHFSIIDVKDDAGNSHISPMHMNDHDGTAIPTIVLVLKGQHYRALELADEHSVVNVRELFSAEGRQVVPCSIVFAGAALETELLVHMTSFINWLEPLLEERQRDYLKMIMPHNIVFQTYLDSQVLSPAAQLKKAHYYRCLAEIDCLLGEPRKAQISLDQVLLIYKSIESDDQKELMEALCMIIQADIERCLGETEKAKERIEELLPLLKRLYGDQSVQVAKALEILAMAYSDLGNAGEKRRLIQDNVLPIYQTLYGNDHIRVANAYFHLANAHGDLTEWKEQRDILEKAVLPIYRKHYGDKHTQTANALWNFAKAVGALGEVQEKIDIIEKEVLPIYQEFYGEQHMQVAYALMSLALAYGDLGGRANHEKRMAILMGQVLPAFERYYEKGNYHIAGVLSNIANTYGSLGEPNKKRAILEEQVLPVFRKHYKQENRYTVDASRDLAEAYGALGDAEKKREILERDVLPIYREFYKDKPSKLAVARALHDLAEAYRVIGNNAALRRALLEEVLVIYTKEYGESDGRTDEIREEIKAVTVSTIEVPAGPLVRPTENPSVDHAEEVVEPVNNSGIPWKPVFGGVAAVSALLFAYYFSRGSFSAKELVKDATH